LYTASEIIAAGGFAGSISAFALNTSSTASMAMGNFTIKIGTTTATNINGAYSTATLTQVYTVGSFTTSVGWQTFEFTTPYTWNGTDNVIIDICFDNSSWSSPNGGVRADYNYGYVYSRYQDNSSGSICGTNSGYGGTGGYRAQAQFTILPPYANDAGIASTISPSLPTCDLDSVDIIAVLTSAGYDTLQNCSIHYKIGSAATVSTYWTGTVNPQGGTDTVTLGNVNFTNGDLIDIWTTDPNNDNDSLASNDHDSTVVSIGLSGTYGIPGDYATINDAANDLHSFGVCGHVIKGQVAHTFGLPCTVWIAHAPLGNQGAEAAIGCAVTRVGEEGFACDEGDAGTCDRADVDRFRVGIMAHGACEAVDVCATELVVTLRPSGGGKVHGIRCAAQKGKAGGKTKLDKGGGRIWRVFTVLRDGATLKCMIVFRHGV